MSAVYTEDPREVPARLTPLGWQEAAEALVLAHWAALDTEPKVETLALLMAQTALETGRWGTTERGLMYCYNFGNIKASLNYPGFHCYYRCNEVLNGKVVEFEPPHPQTRFRAYSSAEDGAFAYVSYIALDTNGDGRNKFERMWRAAEKGDPHLFSLAASKAGYYTADPVSYTTPLVSLFHMYLRWLVDSTKGLPTIRPAPTDTETHSPTSNLDLENIPWVGPDWNAMTKERDRKIRDE